jgi:peptide/nickel transport system permease protein
MSSAVPADARAVPSQAAAAPLRPRTTLRWHLRRVPPIVWLCLVILITVILSALLAPVIAPHDPFEQSLIKGNQAPAWMEGGEAEHLLGTDRIGRDILSRILHGARISLSIGFFAVLIGSTFGSIMGLIAGYFGGWTDELISTLADIQLAMPFILLAITVIAVLGPSEPNLIILVGISGWMTYARVCRGIVIGLREREYVQAVRALGGGDWRIMFRHILPNILSPIVVLGTLDLARLIILESTLSFLGLGIQPPKPSWGGMLGEGRDYLSDAWWISTFPGFAIMLTTLAISRGGDWVRDVLDPTLRSA